MTISEVAIWAITAFYNPLRYESRLRNYRLFRERLRIPLVTVELSLNGVGELGPSNADILAEVCSPDILWHKERLLNIALAHIPSECTVLAWLDCDIIFDRENWAEEAARALEHSSLVQPFGTYVDLVPRAAPPKPTQQRGESLAYRYSRGALTTSDLANSQARVQGLFTPGLAWMARRDLVEEHGFYDACVVGGGDKAIAAAALGVPEIATGYQGMTPHHAEHYLEWARPFGAKVRGRMSSIDGSVYHLWHGNTSERRYGDRYAILTQESFDPRLDLTLNEESCWQWGSRKSGLRHAVQNYFRERCEDGQSTRAVGRMT